MKKAAIVLPLLLLLACSRMPAPAEISDNVSESGAAITEGVITVELSDQKAEELASSLQRGSLPTEWQLLGATSAERMFPEDDEWEDRHRAFGLHRWYRIQFDSARPVTKAVSEFSELPGVICAEPVRKIRSTAYFNDPMSSRQWHLYNSGNPSNFYTAGCDLNVIPVWDNFTAGSNNVVVAVLDGGVQLNHPDLAASCLPAGANGSKCFVMNNEGYAIQADDHGTHVAGIIGAINNNGEGVSGIAGGRDGNGGVRIMSCEILRTNPSDPDKTIGGNEATAFIWAADHGAVIANNSWGYVYDTENDAAKGHISSSLASAIEYFKKNAGCDKSGNQLPDSPMKGGVVFFAAGNEGWQHAWPAEYDKVIAVGSVSSKQTRAYYSNFGSWVDICAPGGDAVIGPTILSTIVDGYDTMQGTSMACPMVSGVAALIASHFGGPGFTAEMLTERLLGGASPSKAPSYGNIGPMVDALGAFSFGGITPPGTVSNFKPYTSSNFIKADWTVTADPDDGKAFGYLLLACKDKSVLEGLQLPDIPADVSYSIIETGEIKAGDSISGSIGGLEFNSTYYTAVAGYDYSLNYSPISEIHEVITGGNLSPVITTEYDGPFIFKAFEYKTFVYKISDPDGHSFSLNVDGGSDAMQAMISAESVLFSFKGKDAPAGKYTAVITATDEYGASTELKIDYEILPNNPPEVVRQVENLLFESIGASQVLNIDDYITDKDGEHLTYEVRVSVSNIAHLNPEIDDEKDIFTVTALGYGLTEATVTAVDVMGETCSVTFRILVRDSSQVLALYPNPVKSTLNVRPRQEGKMQVSISNKAGAKVLELSSDVSPFYPLAVDMSGMPSGTYYLNVTGCGSDGRYSIVKI